ncbi:MAG: ribosome small subunit-dependent GTPase A [Marinilabiliales bacterium]|nr:ribosome small subunit-dependent GTPase A [Marinilabiliales bacterium]
MEKGLVIRSTGSWYTVRNGQNEQIDCRIKGKLRMKGVRTTNPVSVGDIVHYDLQEDATTPSGQSGVIFDIEPRKNYIIRKSSNLSKESQIIAANLDQLFLIVTVNYPVTLTGFIDRYLISAEAYRIPAGIIFNKTDLYQEADRRRMEELVRTYEGVGYPCFLVSAKNNQNIDPLRHHLEGKTTLFSGHSGVGKSSLLNCLKPDLNLKTNEISDHHLQGKHTTTFAEMFELSPGSWLIDTPGIRGFGVIDMEKSEISHFFPEIFRLLDGCRYFNCTHLHEPGCAVKEAVEAKKIALSRYESYLSLMEEDNSKYRAAF